MAQKCRFTAHIRAGHQPQSRTVIQSAIIGDETRATLGQRCLNHRMSSGHNFKARMIGKARRTPAALNCAFGKGGGHIKPRKRIGGFGDGLCAGERRCGQILKMCGLCCNRVRA